MGLKVRAAAVGLSLMVAGPAAADITFTPNYTDGANEGFFDPTLGLQRRTAFQHALNIWGSLLDNSYAGQTITVDASFDPLASGVLGSAGAGSYWNVSGTAYGAALTNHVTGTDQDPSSEIVAQFNSAFGDWYLGTDGNTPNDKWDFVSVVLHEVGHGLNFLDLINSNGSYVFGIPGIYDRFLENGAGTDLTAMSQAARMAALTSGDLFWSGAEGIAGNGGTRGELYAPSPYQNGSSISHLDPSAHPGFLMNPGIFNGSAIHELSALELGMLADMGWDINPVPEPASLGLMCLAGLVALRRRRAA